MPLSAQYARHRYIAILLLLFFVVALVWLRLEVYQSHYIAALRLLGDQHTQVLIGHAQELRGDEWSTYLPLLKQAYLEGFPRQSSLAPYFEGFEWFISIPKLDISLLFLPNHMAYWVLPGGMALSFQGLYYNSLLIFSLVWLLRNLRVEPKLAICAAFMLTFSQFYQVWWTSNFPALAAAFLPFAVATSRLSSIPKTLLLAWSIVHVLFGQIYPPFYIPLAVALLPLMFAIRTDFLHWRHLLVFLLATVIGLGCYALLKWDYILAMASTAYPGGRVSTGGDSVLLALGGLFFPTLPLSLFTDIGEGVYEYSVAGTILPLLTLGVIPELRRDRKALLVTLVGSCTFLTLAVYALLGFPEWLSKLTGFYMVPGRRMHIGLSIVMLVWAAYIISRYWDVLDLRKSVFVAFALYALFSLFSPHGALLGGFSGAAAYGYLPVFLLVFFLLFARVPTSRLHVNFPVLAAVFSMTVAHVVIFGSFNPLMRASDILRPVDTALIDNWKALQQKVNRPIAIPGSYGHVLRGEGLPALEAIHLANVDMDRYKALFPEIGDQARNEVFNQFRGIGFANVGAVEGGVTYKFPLQGRAVEFEHGVIEGPATGQLVQGGVAEEDGAFVLRWSLLLQRDLDIDARLTLTTSCPFESSWLTRFPVNSDGGSLSGLAGTLVLKAPSRLEAELCAKNVSLVY